MQQRRDPVERERVRHGEHVIEHLLRRAGFGAGQDEIDDYLELGLSAAVQQLLNFEAHPTMTSMRLIGKSGYVADHGPRRVLASHRSSTTPVSDGSFAWFTRVVLSRRR